MVYSYISQRLLFEFGIYFCCDLCLWLAELAHWVPVDQSQAEVAAKVDTKIKHKILCSENFREVRLTALMLVWWRGEGRGEIPKWLMWWATPGCDLDWAGPSSPVPAAAGCCHLLLHHHRCPALRHFIQTRNSLIENILYIVHQESDLYVRKEN